MKKTRKEKKKKGMCVRLLTQKNEVSHSFSFNPHDSSNRSRKKRRFCSPHSFRSASSALVLEKERDRTGKKKKKKWGRGEKKKRWI